MLDAAKNKVRVKISYMMIALTVLGCVVMVIEGKQVRAGSPLSLLPREAGRQGMAPHFPLRRGRCFLHEKDWTQNKTQWC